MRVASRVSAVDVFHRDEPLFVESDSGRIAKYPHNVWVRWGLRIVVAAAYIALAIWANVSSGGDWSGTANGDLAQRSDDLRLDFGNVGILGQLYPPITGLAALVIPGGAFGLSVAGAIVAGLTIQQLIEAQQRKGLHPAVRIVFTLTLATIPMYTYVVTTNFEATVGLMFFALGMLNLVRFVTFANTQAGFRAGMLFACSAFSDSQLGFAALVASIGGGLLVQSRHGARFANAIVVGFPTVALFVALAVLGIAFGGGPFAMVRGELAWDPEKAHTFVAFLGTPSGWLYLAPMVVIIVTAILLRHPLTGLIAVLLNASTALAFIVGLTPPGTAGATYIMLLVLAITIVPTATTWVQRGLTMTVSLVLYAIGWATAFTWTVVRTWMEMLGGSLS